MRLSERDRRAFLRAFGVPVIVAGFTESALLRNDYADAEFSGPVRIATNAPMIDMMPEDIRRLSLDVDGTVRIDGVDYLAKEFQPDTHGNWTTVRLIEAI